uniref:Uncharacterized protein n=1 Tax=Zooxanthella nutricula TaxID=1333877 RepID=A0A7S2LVD8_9DINO
MTKADSKKRQAEKQKPSAEATRVAEQILAVLNNIASIPKDSRDDFFGDFVADLASQFGLSKLRQLLEWHTESPMVQHQGFALIGQILLGRKSFKHFYAGFGDHVSAMIRKHKGTPVADTGELLLEEVA